MHAPLDLLGPKTAIMVLIFAAVFLAAQAGSGLVRSGISRRAVNRRLATAERTGSLGELVLELRKQRGLKEDGQGRTGFFAGLVLRSGVVYEPRKWILYVVGVGLVTTIVVFVISHKPLFAFPAGIVAAVLGPYVYLVFLAKRRAKLLGKQLPNALEIVVRSLEAGHPVATAVALVGREMPDPIGSEFGMAADEIAYGATLEQAIGNVAARCKHDDFDLFAATIRLQERSGGNLVGLLKMNAHTIRERQKMRMKIHAASSEGRASAMILSSLPIIMFAVIQVITPDFYASVWHENLTKICLAAAGGWMGIGNLIMFRMVNFRI